jgi:Carboxypeptidase regulatory-like domain
VKNAPSANTIRNGFPFLRTTALGALALFVSGALVQAQAPATAPATLVQTIDLATSKVTPVVGTFAVPVPSTVIDNFQYMPVPQPPPGSAFSLTGIAVDPVTNTIYVADHASSNVYMIDGGTNAVTSAVYTYGLFGNADGLPSSTSSKVVTTVLANPLTNRWLFMGGDGGAQFNGTTFAEGVAGQAMQSGGAWDPVTGNVYGASGVLFWATQNLKFLNAAFSSCNATAFNSATLRVYATCFLGLTGATATTIANTPNYGIVAFDGADPAIQTRVGLGPMPFLGEMQNASAQPTGIAVNANTNRIYIAAGTSPTSLDIVDANVTPVPASTAGVPDPYTGIIPTPPGQLQLLASIPGLPDQSTDFLLSAALPPLPRPIAINTVTNTVFVLNSVSSTISVFDGNTNRFTGTINIPVPDGAVLALPIPPVDPVTNACVGCLMQEIKTGNSFFDRSNSTVTSLGGAVALAVNEATNTLYVASVNGTISVFALDPPVAPATFSVNGEIRDAQGAPAAGVTVTATGSGGSVTAVTDAFGLYVLTGLPAGTYTVKPASDLHSFVPASQSTIVNSGNVSGIAFTANPPLPPISPASIMLSPWAMIGAGVTTNATVTLNQPAPSGGIVLALSSSNAKAAKVASTATVPAGQSAVSFPVQGSGVSTTTFVTLSATFNGATASTVVTVAPGDKLSITSVTYSKSQQRLQVNATSTNAGATLVVQNANTNAIMGTMTNLGDGTYTFQLNLATGVPTSVNVISNLGSKTGQGVSVVQ